MSRIVKLANSIERANERAHDVWFGRTKFSYKHEAKLRLRLHKLDEIRNSAYHQLWDEYEDEPDEVELIEEYRDPWNRIRFLFCDGQFHFHTNKNEELIYGVECDC